MSDRQEVVAMAIQATAQLLLESAERAEIALSGDRRVTETGAAKLLGYSAANLKALRQAGTAQRSTRWE